MSNNPHDDLPSNEEVLKFVRSNTDKLPICYTLLTPYQASTYPARISHTKTGELQDNLGVFYKPISIIYNASE